MAENNDAPQIPHKKPDSEIRKSGEPGAAGKKLHDEASKEWFREAKEARKSPLKVGEDQKYTVQHGDCLSDIAMRRLRTDKEKVDGHAIAKEERRLRELNSGQFHSLETKGAKRDFLADGWHLKIYDSVHTKPEVKPETKPETKPANPTGKPTTLDVPPLPVPRPKIQTETPPASVPLPPERPKIRPVETPPASVPLPPERPKIRPVETPPANVPLPPERPKIRPVETPPANVPLPPERPKIRPVETPPAAPLPPERPHVDATEHPLQHHSQPTDPEGRHHRNRHQHRPCHQIESTDSQQPPRQTQEPKPDSKPISISKQPERLPETVAKPPLESPKEPRDEGVRKNVEPRAGDPVPQGILGSLTRRPDGTPVTPVYIGMPGEAALKANGTDTTTHDLRGQRIELAGVRQWLDGGKNHDGPAYAYMAASNMLGTHVPLQAEGVSPHDSQNSAGRTDLQAHICTGLCSHSNHNHWGGAIDVKDDSQAVRRALEAVGFRNTGRNFNDPHHWDWQPTAEQRRLVASFGAKVNDTMIASNR